MARKFQPVNADRAKGRFYCEIRKRKVIFPICRKCKEDCGEAGIHPQLEHEERKEL